MDGRSGKPLLLLLHEKEIVVKRNRFINKLKALDLIVNSKKYRGLILNTYNRSFTRLWKIELMYHIEGSECPIISHNISRRDISE